jgi:hypothetical protein
MSDYKKDLYKSSPFLYYWDIEEHAPVTLTITGHGDQDAFNPGTKEAGVLWCLKFKGANKMLGLNKTNGFLVERAVGTAHKEEWIGKQITLRVAECKGEKCIRVDGAQRGKMPSKYPRFKYTDGEKKGGE